MELPTSAEILVKKLKQRDCEHKTVRFIGWSITRDERTRDSICSDCGREFSIVTDS